MSSADEGGPLAFLLSRPLYVGCRVLVQPNDDRGTVMQITTYAAGDQVADARYTVHLDAGGDLTDVAHGDLQRDNPEEAVRRITKRRGESWLRAGDAIGAVLSDESLVRWHRTHADDNLMSQPTMIPTLVDDLDALTAMRVWRAEIDTTERRLIEAAREKGASWDQVGLALGFPVKSAKQAGRQRWRRLAGPTAPVPVTLPAPDAEVASNG